MTDLGTLGGSYSFANAINDSGQIVGYSTTSAAQNPAKAGDAFLYNNGTMTNLGTLPGFSSSFATAINDSRQIVGDAIGNNGEIKPFLYGNGVMTNLNSLLPANSGWTLLTATGINDQGMISGTGSIPGGGSSIVDGYLLFTPPPTGSGGTTTTLQANLLSPVYGQPVNLTAAVSPNAVVSGTPAGSVTFYDGSTDLGAVTIDGGTASLSLRTLPVGVDSITASYGGNSQFEASTSTTVDVTVQEDQTSVAITSSANPSEIGQEIAFTAVVTPVAPGSGTPTGTITFMDGTTTLGTAALSGGTATYSISTLASGSHMISAVYNGDTSFLAGASPFWGRRSAPSPCRVPARKPW
jgi:probable HAF family extracellular repeat protein